MKAILGAIGVVAEKLSNALRRLVCKKDGYSSRQGIALQTRERWNIPNSQEGEIGNFEQNTAHSLREKYRSPAVEFRTDPIPIYNCHGMTFGSRRTTIVETFAVRKMLRDDRYEKVLAHDEVLPGDIVLYVASDGDIQHSGIVVGRPDPTFRIPAVCSKWGKGWEVIHPANRCEYLINDAHMEYYRVTR